MATSETRRARARRALRLPIMIPRYLNARRKLLSLLYRQRRNNGILSLHLERRTGFFSHLVWATCIFSYCHRHDLIPHVTVSNPRYTDPRRGPNCLAYFFENPAQDFIDANLVETTTIREFRDLGLPAWCLSRLTLEHGSMLFHRYMPVRQEIIDEVEEFCAAHFEGRSVLGVHFRGTDKQNEAPRVSPEQCRHAISRYLTDHPEVERLFVASDESEFIRFIQAEFGSVRVCFCNDQRSEGTLAVHNPAYGGDNYKKGREAVVNCMLLSRCTALIRTASTLSGWASVFNPSLPVILLNRPYPGRLFFPDREVILRADMAEL